jgi:Prenyltransferase and squalene oxidase repeat
MSLRLEMLQVARLAPQLLGESTELVRQFLLGRQTDDGGFQNRSGQSDLYYTVFALDGLLALDKGEVPSRVSKSYAAARNFLGRFGSGTGLDFVHRCCLTRAWATVGSSGKLDRAPSRLGPELAAGIESFRSGNGGYHPEPGSPEGTAYGAFLALGAYQDLGLALPAPERLVESLVPLETSPGGWANEVQLKTGATNATAAAVAVLRNLGRPIKPSVGKWLLDQAHPQGGFRAVPGAPIPDLLSTATALHALAGLEVSFTDLKEPCLDFLDTLWTSEGGFHGHWAEDHLDVEYTYYGLLALGHLRLA